MKSYLKFPALIFAICLVFLPLFSACDKKDNGGEHVELVIYNWEDYIDIGDSEMGRNNILDDFCAYYREVTGDTLTIKYTTFDTNETMMTKVLNNDANVDLICPSEYAIEKLLLAGKLENQKKLYEELKPTLDGYGIDLDGMSSVGKGDGTIEDEIMNVIRVMFGSIEDGHGNTLDMTEYMVPYMWGTLGILYNKDVISQEELDEYGWGVLWNVQNNEELENKILMKDSVRDTYAAALFYMYEYDLLPEKYKDIKNAQDLINVTDDEMVEAAERVLTEQRDHISGYEVDFGKDDMINEIVYADFAWSGDALWAVEESYDEDDEVHDDGCFLGYYCPTGVNPKTEKERFSNIWYDGWVIPTTVKNPLAAMMFIDYMARPQNAVRNSVAIGYTCAADKQLMSENDEALAFLEEQEYDVEEYFSNVGRYPEINFALGVMRDFGGENEKVVNMWQRAKSGAGVDMSLVYVIVAIVGAFLIAALVYIIAQLLKRRPKKLSSAE